MKTFVTLYLLLNFVSAYPSWFEEYKVTYSKEYTANEEARAFEVLRINRHFIEQHADPTLHLALNEHSDRNSTRKHQFHRRHRRRRLTERKPFVLAKAHVPSSFDWRTHHYVGPARRQGSCDGCYAFASVEHLEFWYKRLSGKFLKLSVQRSVG